MKIRLGVRRCGPFSADDSNDVRVPVFNPWTMTCRDAVRYRDALAEKKCVRVSCFVHQNHRPWSLGGSPGYGNR